MLAAARCFGAASPVATGALATRLTSLPPFKYTGNEPNGLRAISTKLSFIKSKKIAFGSKSKNALVSSGKTPDTTSKKRDFKRAFLMQKRKHRMRLSRLDFEDFGKKHVPPYFFQDRDCCLRFARWMHKQMDYKPWKEVLGKDFIRHHGKGLLEQYKGHVLYMYEDLKLLRAPDLYNLKAGTPNGYYKNIENRKKVMAYLSKKLGHEKIEDWYRTTSSHFYRFKVHRLLSHYDYSPRKVVMETFPEFAWKRELFYDARAAKQALKAERIKELMKDDVGKDAAGVNFVSLSSEINEPFIKETRKKFAFKKPSQFRVARGRVIYKMPLPYLPENDRVATPEEASRQYREQLSQRTAAEINQKLQPPEVELKKEMKAREQNERFQRILEEEKQRREGLTEEEREKEDRAKRRADEIYLSTLPVDRYYGVEAAGTRLFNSIPEISLLTSHKDFISGINKVKTVEEAKQIEKEKEKEEVISLSAPSSSSSSDSPPSTSLVTVSEQESVSLMQPIKQLFWKVLHRAPIISFVFRISLRSMRYEFEAKEPRPDNWYKRRDQQRAFLDFFEEYCRINTADWYRVQHADFERSGGKEILELYDNSIAKMVMTVIPDKYPWVESFFLENQNKKSESNGANSEEARRTASYVH